jgi:hypothetical protein
MPHVVSIADTFGSKYRKAIFNYKIILLHKLISFFNILFFVVIVAKVFI